MSALTKQQVKIIATALKNQTPRVKATSNWIKLVAEYGLGEVRGGQVHFSRQDYKTWREILMADVGFDPTQETIAGNRTEVASLTPNEKWSTESVWASMVSTTVIGGNLITTKGACGIVPGVEYRVGSNALRPGDYDALLVVENYEAFLFIHRFQLPELGHVLVLYRGHDVTSRVVASLLDSAVNKPVIGFTDPDPAGVGLLIDNKALTHALIPEAEDLSKAPKLTQRFADQLAARANLKAQSAERSEAFKCYVNLIVDKGVAISQEWLSSHRVRLRLVAL